MVPVYMFDDGKGSLSPLTDLWFSFDVRTGALTTLERLRRVLGAGRAWAFGKDVAGVFVPAGREAWARESHTLAVNPSVSGNAVALVNGRCAGPQQVTELALGEASVDLASGDLV